MNCRAARETAAKLPRQRYSEDHRRHRLCGWPLLGPPRRPGFRGHRFPGTGIVLIGTVIWWLLLIDLSQRWQSQKNPNFGSPKTDETQGAQRQRQRGPEAPKAQPSRKRTWRTVLGFKEDENPGMRKVRSAYRRLAKSAHPGCWRDPCANDQIEHRPKRGQKGIAGEGFRLRHYPTITVLDTLTFPQPNVHPEPTQQRSALSGYPLNTRARFG